MIKPVRKKLFILILGFLLVVPAYAVFNEKNITRTISVLRHELHLIWSEKNDLDLGNEKASQMSEVKHREFVSTVRRINELTLILYSQETGFTLDQTYAMDGVMSEYEKFNKKRSPKFSNIGALDTEIERYQRLIEALRLLPPRLEVIDEVPDTLRQEMESFDDEIEILNQFLDSLLTPTTSSELIDELTESYPTAESKKNLLVELALSGRNSRKEAADTSESVSFMLPLEAQEDRDSCIAYATAIIHSYTRQKELLQEDEFYYTEMKRRLQQTYDYSKERFAEIQNYLFDTGQEPYTYVLSNLKKYAYDASKDMEKKYGSGDEEQDKAGLRESQWRGLVLAGSILEALFYVLMVSLAVILLFCVILRKVKPFNTEWFKKTKPVVLMLAVAVIYSFFISASLLMPMSNSMLVVACLMLVYLWFVIALLLSILIGLKNDDVRAGLRAFLPVLVMGLLVMFCRSIFLPDKMIHLLATPILAAFLIWQIIVLHRFRIKTKDYRSINRLLTVTALVFGWSLLISLYGFSLLALMFIMWWIFQVATFTTLTSITYILRYYEKKGLAKQKEKYAVSHQMVSKNEEGDFIRVTWLFDLIKKALIPILGILSVLGCIWLAAGVFNLTETCRTIFHKPFFDLTDTDGSPMLQVSLFKLAATSSWFFIYRYLYYLARSLYRVNKFEKVMASSGNNFVRKNDVNLTLAYNVIGIIIWGMFILYAIHLLKIPLGAISIVAAGLATGIGLALKDVLNNFIYGIQLMSGRLRVGDIVECDGIRGTVEKISYQSTEIQTITGSVMSFTNATLFNKNFQNLTKNSPYEYLSIPISISYGEDVTKVRELILNALDDFTKRKDKYGRFVVEHKAGIRVGFDSFGDSSVNIAIKQMVLVESIYSYRAEVKELIYKLFNDNGIVIPFPQQEVSILNFPK